MVHVFGRRHVMYRRMSLKVCLHWQRAQLSISNLKMTWNVGNVAIQRRSNPTFRDFHGLKPMRFAPISCLSKFASKVGIGWNTYSNCLIFLVIDFEGASKYSFLNHMIDHGIIYHMKHGYNLKLASPCTWISVKKVAPSKEVQHWWVPLAASRCEAKATRELLKGLKGAVTSAISEMSRISLLELTLEIQCFSVEIQ